MPFGTSLWGFGEGSESRPTLFRPPASPTLTETGVVVASDPAMAAEIGVVVSISASR